MVDTQVWNTSLSIRVVIARQRQTHREVCSWEPGRVIALNTDVSSGVELVSDGRVIAQGELVDVHGKMGVRIL